MNLKLIDLSASPYRLMSQLIPIYTSNCYLSYFSFSIFCVHLQTILQPTFSFHVGSDLIMSADLQDHEGGKSSEGLKSQIRTMVQLHSIVRYTILPKAFAHLPSHAYELE